MIRPDEILRFRPLRSALLAALVLCVLPATAVQAQPQLAVMGIRSAEAKLISAATQQSLDTLFQQEVGRLPGVRLVPEATVLAALGQGAAQMVGACSADTCMGQIGAMSGMDGLVYAVVARSGKGFTLYLRALGIKPFRVISQASPTCASCTESDLVPLLMATDQKAFLGPLMVAFGRPVGKNPGRLSVTTRPPGATVHVDGVKVGNAPIKDHPVGEGSHTLMVSHQGFSPSTLQLKVRGGARVTKRVTLGKPGGLKIQVSAGGKAVAAALTVDGKPIGNAPWENTAIPPGRYALKATAPGYRTAERRLLVRSGRVDTIRLKLIAAQGSLSLTTQPTGAEVFDAQKKSLGKTPLRRKALAPGSHALVVRKAGYAEQTLQLQIKDRADTRHRLSLVPLPAELKVITVVDGEPLAGTTATLDGQHKTSTPATFKGLKPGRHSLELSQPGMVTVKKQISLGPGESKEISVPLRVPAGTLALSSTPPGAEVRAGEKLLGKTPGRFRMTAGEYQLTLRLEKHREATATVQVADQRTVRKQIRLTPDPPVLSVTSQPEGAEVKIDGKVAGKTPLKRDDLRPGAHAVEVSLEGYRTERRRVRLMVKQLHRIEARLEPRLGLLKVTTAPGGAAVEIDGKEVGKTPLVDHPTLMGSRELRLRLHGYQEVSRRVSVEEGKQTTVSMTLIKAPGQLAVISTPAGAEVTLDGAVVGTTPHHQQGVPIGEHTVVVKLTGHKTVERKVSVAAAQVVALDLSLEISDEARAEALHEAAMATRLWIMIGAFGASAALAAGGGFFLSADADKRGAVSAAVQDYNVYLTDRTVLDGAEVEARRAEVERLQAALEERPDKLMGQISLVAAALAAGAGAYLLLVPPQVEDFRPGAALIPLPGGGGALSVVGRF